MSWHFIQDGRYHAQHVIDGTHCRCNATMIRVFLLDDDELVRLGVRHLLDAADDLEVVGEAENVAEAVALGPAATPDVALLDVQLPDGTGIEVCRELRSLVPELRCLMLTSLDNAESEYQAMMAGASGYLLKNVRGAALVASIRRVAAGEILLDPLAAG
ncbi:MAG: response regulator transcription factor, partial [Aeromicrobium sp.]